MQKIILIGIAGAFGALSRFGLAGAVQKLTGPAFPFGTFAANILGSFLFGLVWGAFEQRLPFSGEARIIILTGFMGSFTTFSTYMFESHNLIRQGQWLLAGANIFGQIIVGLLFLSIGLALTKNM